MVHVLHIWNNGLRYDKICIRQKINLVHWSDGGRLEIDVEDKDWNNGVYVSDDLNYTHDVSVTVLVYRIYGFFVHLSSYIYMY